MITKEQIKEIIVNNANEIRKTGHRDGSVSYSINKNGVEIFADDDTIDIRLVDSNSDTYLLKQKMEDPELSKLMAEHFNGTRIENIVKNAISGKEGKQARMQEEAHKGLDETMMVVKTIHHVIKSEEFKGLVGELLDIAVESKKQTMSWTEKIKALFA